MNTTKLLACVLVLGLFGFSRSSLTPAEQDILNTVGRHYKKDAFPKDHRNRLNVAQHPRHHRREHVNDFSSRRRKSQAKRRTVPTPVDVVFDNFKVLPNKTSRLQKDEPVSQTTDASNRRPLVGVYISVGIQHIKVTDGSIAIALLLTLQWFDERLNLPADKVRPKFELPPSLEVWKPEIRFIPKLQEESSTITLTPANASLEWEIISRGVIPCEWTPSYFPFEKRTCDISIKAEQGLNFECRDRNGCVVDSIFEQPRGFTLTTYSWLNVENNEPELALQFMLPRSATVFFIFTMYIPSAALVLLLWIFGFSKRRTVRAVLSSTGLLCLIFMWVVQRNLQESSSEQLTLLDVWFFGCFLLQVFAIIEFVIVNNVRKTIDFPFPAGQSAFVDEFTKTADSRQSSLEIETTLAPTGVKTSRSTTSRSSVPRSLIASSVSHRRKRKLHLHGVFMFVYPICSLMLAACYIIVAGGIKK